MEQRNSRSFKIIIFFEILIIISLLTVFIFLFIKSNKLHERYNNVKNELESLNISSIENEISTYQNIDEEIAKKYDEYYTNISLLEQKIINKETDVKIAYLTFDDGPYKLTYSVLDLLKENNIRATFFVLGKDGAEDRYLRQVNEGHTLANHTMYHNIGSGLYSSVNSFMSQVNQLEDYLYNITGHKTTLVRFPGGSSTARNLKSSIVEQLHNKGYNYVDWTCETGDGSDKKLQQQDTYSWYQQTCKQDIMVLLMHDYNYSTYSNLQRIIDDLKSKNYIFLPLHNKSVMVK